MSMVRGNPDEGDDLVDMTAQVGSAGEAFFNLLANAGPGVSNRAAADRLGWDFHLQMPRAQDWHARHTLDTRPPEPSCFVQVKASTRTIRSWRLKLSSWERLAKERRPAFLFVALFEPGNLTVPRRAYLIHLGDELLGRVLARLRATPNEDSAELHERYLSFSWDESDALEDLSGASLVESVRRHIGPDLLEYEQRKSRLIQTLGYPEKPYRLSMEISGSDAADLQRKVADFAAGLNKRLMVNITSTTLERFGIERPVVNGPPAGPAEIQFSDAKPDLVGEVELLGLSTRERVRAACSLHLGGPFARLISEKYRRMRIVIDGGEILVANEGDDEVIKVSFALPGPGEYMPLSRAVRRANVGLALSDPKGCEMRVRSGAPYGSPLVLPAYANPRPLGYATLIRIAGVLASRAGLDPEAGLEPDKLIGQAQILLLCGLTEEMTITVRPPSGNQFVDTSAAAQALLVPSEVQLGAFRISCIVGFVGNVQIDHDARTVTAVAVPDVLATLAGDAEEPVSVVDVRSLCQNAVHRLQQRGVTEFIAPPGFTQLLQP